MTVLVKSSLFVHTMTNYTQFLYCPLLDFSTFLMVFHSLRLPSLRSFLILSTRFHSLVLLAPSRLHPLPFHLQLLDLLSLDFLLYHTRSIYIFSPSSILAFLPFTPFVHVNFAALEYTGSVLPFASSYSNSSHFPLQHSFLALVASLCSLLFNCGYLFFPSSLFLLFHVLLLSILLIISCVTNDFCIRAFFS